MQLLFLAFALGLAVPLRKRLQPCLGAEPDAVVAPDRIHGNGTKRMGFADRQK